MIEKKMGLTINVIMAGKMENILIMRGEKTLRLDELTEYERNILIDLGEMLAMSPALPKDNYRNEGEMN